MARPEVTGRANSTNPGPGVTAANALAPPTIRLMSKAEVLSLIGVTYTTLYHWMCRGEFPLARELGPPGGKSTRVAWIESEIMDWIASRPQRQLGKTDAA